MLPATLSAEGITSAFWTVFAATGFTFSMTAAGAALVLFLKPYAGRRIQPLALGFAAGIMLAAGVWSLLLPAIDAAEKAGGPGWVPAAGGFILGALFLAALDKLLPHQHPDSDTPEGPATNLDRTTLLALAVTLHNIPEGMSVGLTFAVATMSGDSAAWSAAAALALGIGIQNIPEGTAVALPLMSCGYSRFKAFAAGALSGLVEPVFGLLTVSAAGVITPFMPWLLAFAAGAMFYVVVEELIPAAHLNSHSDSGTIAVLAGFLLMMVLDTALG